MFEDFDAYIKHKGTHNLSCPTCRSTFKSAQGMGCHLRSKAHKMAVALEERYLSSASQVPSPDVDMDLPEDENSTNIVYTTKSSQNTTKEVFFRARSGLKDTISLFSSLCSIGECYLVLHVFPISGIFESGIVSGIISGIYRV